MDSILKITLATTFFMGGITYSAIMLLIYVLTGGINLNYMALFGLTMMFTYSIYGFFGLIYVLLALMASALCALMYWYDFTFQTQTLYTFIQLQMSESLKNSCDQYKQRFNDAVTKLGLTNERITIIKKYYQSVNTVADKLITFVYHYTSMFINLTSDTPGFKQIYNYYGKARVALHGMYIIMPMIRMSLQNIGRNTNRSSQSSQSSRSSPNPNLDLGFNINQNQIRTQLLPNSQVLPNDMMNNLAQLIDMFESESNTVNASDITNTNSINHRDISDTMMKTLFGNVVDAKSMHDKLNDMADMKNVEELEELMKGMLSSIPKPT